MSPADRKFDLGDYIEVKDRIKLFYELYAQGRLVTTDVRLSNEPDGTPRVLVEAAAYRTPDDPLPGRGWSWMELPGKTTYTRGSELENTETSAWGRAIASLGILVDKSIASAQEVQNKQDGKPPAPQRPLKEVKHHDPDKSLIGMAELGKADSGVDFELHDGQLAFRLTQGKTSYKVVTFDRLAEQLAEHRDSFLDQRVKVWGTMESEAYSPPRGATVWYSVVHAVKVTGPDLTLPLDEPESAPDVNPEGVSPLRDPEQAVIPVAEGQEPLFDQAESDRLDREAAVAG